jgi:hypothetical protein
VKRLIVLALVPIFFCLGDVNLGCGSGDGKTNAADTPQNRLTDAVNGQPDEITRQAEAVLETALTAGELKYLGSVDWNAFANGGILTDPVSRKALAALMPLVKDKGLLADTGGFNLMSRACAQTAPDACSAAVENVVSALKIFFSGGSGCLGGALSGTPGWQSCLAASMASVAIALNASRCDLDDPSLPTAGQAADKALACNSCVEKICNEGTLANCTTDDLARICNESIKSATNFRECMYQAEAETDTCLRNISCTGTNGTTEIEACYDQHWAPWHDKSADEFYGSYTVNAGACPHYSEEEACITACITASPDPSIAPCVQVPSDIATCEEKITYDLCTGASQLIFEQCQLTCIKTHLP